MARRRIRRGRPRLSKYQKIAYRRKMYYDYVSKKEKIVNRLEDKGLPVKDPTVLDFDAYETYFKDYKKEFKGRSAKQINSLMCSDEAYFMTEKQYRGVKKSLKENEEFFRALPSYEKLQNTNRELFRTGKVSFTEEDYEVMRKIYYEIKSDLIASGVNKSDAWKQASQEIGMKYFGGSGKS